MDTEWFAVDRCGHVALFASPAAGTMPAGAVIHSGPSGGDAELSGMIFGDGQASDAAAAGLFRYAPEDGGVQVRDSSPVKPILLQDLPESVEAKLQTLRFQGLCFLEATRIRPEDHAACGAPPSAGGVGKRLRRWFGGTS